MRDYDRIARILRYLDQHRTEQPSLARLAAECGLGPDRFHELFVRWAGVTPKDFLQVLTLAHARECLARGESVLGAALASGLSGPGRLHDLCVGLDRASPGELKSGGAGWSLRHGFAATPFGAALIAEGPRGLCHLAFLDEGSEPTALGELAAAWPAAELVPDEARAHAIAEAVFHPEPGSRASGLRAFVRGSAFQLRVWRALLALPPGALVSYGTLARALGMPGAARAIGGAVAANPLAYLIPCHRVIRETGALGGYRWGGERKRALLAHEALAAAGAAQSTRTR